MFNVQIIKIKTPVIARQWAAAVRAAGGGFAPNSLVIASNLARVLQAKSYYPKIKYLLPLLGVGINAALIPLIDILKVGAATNVSFTDGDFSQTTGLQGDGSSKYLNSLIKPSQLGSTNNGGLGYWENNISFGANVQPMGCYNADSSNRFVLDLRNTSQSLRWGNAGNAATQASTAVNGHYYGQRDSATSRALYLNGTSIGTSSANDATSGANEINIAIVGALEPSPAPWPGRCAVAYLTDGTLTAGEIADFDATLRNYLLGPIGRPMS